MLCDYIVLILLGLSRNDLTRTTMDISIEHLSQILREVAKYCNNVYPESLHQQAYLPREIKYQPIPPYMNGYKKYNYIKSGNFLWKRNNLKVPGYRYDSSINLRSYISPSRIDVPRVIYVNDQPIIGDPVNIRKLVTFDQPNNGDMYIKFSKQKVLSLISPEQLASLYNEKLAYDVPTNDPLEPKQVAISALFIENLLKMKSGFEEGVYGASKIVNGVLGIGGGFLGLLKDGAKGIGKMLLTHKR